MARGNTLDLFGDGDDTDLIEQVEASFGIEFEEGETESLETVGDLQDVLVQKLGADDRCRRGCLSAAAFYRLRRAIPDGGRQRSISPATRLAASLVGGDYRKWRRTVEERSGLRLPAGQEGLLEFIVFLPLFFGGPIAAVVLFFVFGAWGLLALGGWALIGLPVRLRPDAAPSDCPEIGSLAKLVACLNYGGLSDEIGSRHPDDVFLALEGIIRHSTDFDGTLDRQTTFFA